MRDATVRNKGSVKLNSKIININYDSEQPTVLGSDQALITAMLNTAFALLKGVQTVGKNRNQDEGQVSEKG